jgi:hypothetical protein
MGKQSPSVVGRVGVESSPQSKRLGDPFPWPLEGCQRAGLEGVATPEEIYSKPPFNAWDDTHASKTRGHFAISCY